MEVNRQFLESRGDAAEFLEPADALLDHASAAVGALSNHVAGSWRACSFSLCGITASIFCLGSQSRIAARCSLCPRPACGACAAAGSFATRPMSVATPGRSPIRLRLFVDLARRDFDGKRSARAVRNNVELRSKPASAAAQRVVGGFVWVSLETFFQPRRRHGRRGR